MLKTILLITLVASSTSRCFDPKKGCDIPGVIEKLFCKAMANVITVDDGKLSKYTCGCVAAFYVSNMTICHAKDYDFPDSPACKKLFHGEEYGKAVTTSHSFTEFLVVDILKKRFNICNEKHEEKRVKNMELFFTSKELGDIITKRMKLRHLPMIKCYEELKKFATKC